MMIANGCARPAPNGQGLTYRVAPATAEADPPVLADHGPARKALATGRTTSGDSVEEMLDRFSPDEPTGNQSEKTMTLIQIRLVWPCLPQHKAPSGKAVNDAQTIADTQTLTDSTFSCRAEHCLAGYSMGSRDLDSRKRRGAQGH